MAEVRIARVLALGVDSAYVRVGRVFALTVEDFAHVRIGAVRATTTDDVAVVRIGSAEIEVGTAAVWWLRTISGWDRQLASINSL